MKHPITILLLILCNTYLSAQSMTKMYDKGIKYFNKGNFEKGHSTLQKLLKKDSTHKEALYSEGFYTLLEGKPNQANEYFERLIAHHPEQPDGFIGRATVYMMDDNLESAELDLIRAYSFDSTSAEIHTAFGHLYSIASLFNKSNSLLDKALSLDPNYAQAYLWLGVNNWVKSENKDAIAHIEKCLSIEPYNVEAHKVKAYILFEMGKYEAVAKTYELLAKEIPNALFELDLYTWGTAYFHGKKYNAANKVMAFIKEPHFPKTFYTQARLAYVTGHTSLALKKLNTAIEKGIEEEENIAQMLYDRSVIYAKSKAIEKAKKDFIDAIKSTPELIEKRNAEGKNVRLLGDAKYLLGKHFSTQQLDSIRIVGWQEKALDLALNNEIKEANSTINKAIELQKNNSKTQAIKGVVVALTGDFKKSYEYFDLAETMPISRDINYIYYLKATILYQMGNYDAVIKCVNQGLEKIPDNPDFYFLRAEALHQLDNTPDALKSIEKAINLDPEDEEFHLEKAYYLFELEQPEKALNICNRMINKNTLNMDATYCRALIYFDQQKLDLAKSDLEKCLRYYPKDNEVKTTYDELIDAMK